MRLQIKDMVIDFFLPEVSARTEVGSSNITIQNIPIFDMRMISGKLSHVYL